jgi:isoleucyl-tRNA synthetase
LNKTLKDIIVRYHILQGERVTYRPGWDCHGLPIELKALEARNKDTTKKKNKKSKKISSLPPQPGEEAVDPNDPLWVRRKAKEFAEEAIVVQKEAFQRWGVLGDWESPYRTMDPRYEAKQLEIFFDMYRNGIIYRDFKPVYWSPSSKTALAEAELDYNMHDSKAIFVAFPLCQKAQAKLSRQASGSISALIWTTTPWTIPANRAICLNTELDYCLISLGTSSSTNDERYIIARENLEVVEEDLGPVTILEELDPAELVGEQCQHAWDPTRHVPILNGRHVIAGRGRGEGLLYAGSSAGNSQSTPSTKCDLRTRVWEARPFSKRYISSQFSRHRHPTPKERAWSTQHPVTVWKTTRSVDRTTCSLTMSSSMTLAASRTSVARWRGSRCLAGGMMPSLKG